MTMKVLVLGGGGREHALVAALNSSTKSNSPKGEFKNCGEVEEIFVWRGSSAMVKSFNNVCLLEADSLLEALGLAKVAGVDFCVVGEEKWLVTDGGVADACEAMGIRCWGPSAKSAQLEASKLFAKNFMFRHGVPTASFKYGENFSQALAIISEAESEKSLPEENSQNLTFPLAIKFDGLAAGKGVRICQNFRQADDFLVKIFRGKVFGEGGVVIEDFLSGREVSVFCAVVGSDYQILLPAQDYKKLSEDSASPNTGGMGAIASQALLSTADMDEIESRIIRPTVLGLAKEGLYYKGFLYFGLILTDGGVRVLEYNCRFGDPEAQVVLPMLEGDFVKWLAKASRGELDRDLIKFKPGWSLCVVLAGKNYPTGASYGDRISGLERVSSVSVFHSGTVFKSGEWLTNGGRILSVGKQSRDSSYGLAELRQKVYTEVGKISFAGMQFRRDIGLKKV